MGRVLGDRYRVLGLIAEGGMGTVYKAEHVVLGRRLAVKVLRPEFSTDEDLVRRFQREAVAASKLGQENIVDVTDFGRTREGNLYFVMEQLEGRSLAAVLHAEGPLAYDRTCLILAQLCRALAAAHGHGIVHRDLKPDNVVVMKRADGSDFVKVVDFGISKSPGEGEDRITRAGTIIGTPEYMAPEQGSAGAVDHRADIYAFGILAYEMLTGTIPFQGATAVATLVEHQTRVPDPPGKRRAGIPRELDWLILKALEKKPQNRQQSMAELGGDLSRVLALYGLPPVFERGRTPPPVPAPRPGHTALFRPQSKRGATMELEGERLPVPSAELLPAMEAARRQRAGWKVALGVGLLALVAAGGAWLSHRVTAPAEAAVPDSTPALSEGPQQRARVEGPTATSTPTPTPTATPTEVAAPKVEREVAVPPAPAAAPPKRGAPARGKQEVGPEKPVGENPYRKLEDLKPEPY
ncbi:MAG: serine/threonine protein kinase [Deltaproteobacteria bacterium]|nr:serine/threonine protein kinase [Deltaproteobacteria bacterium]